MTAQQAKCTGIFSAKEEKYKHFLDVQRERMLFNWDRVKEKLSIEGEKIDLEKQEKYARWELEKAVTMQGIEQERERS